jgi:hypothetical protein
MNKLSAEFRRVLQERGWNEDRYREAVNNGDEEEIIQEHPSKWMTRDETERTW